jgi:hypothetical protein
MTTPSTHDDVEERLRAQLRRISQLEEDNAALREVNGILRKAVAYYAPLCAPLFAQEDRPGVKQVFSDPRE